VSLRERFSRESQSNALDRAAPRVNAPREMGPSFAENFREITPTPTFKKPLKPPLLLFELLVSEPARCSWVPAHAWLDWPQLPPGILQCNYKRKARGRREPAPLLSFHLRAPRST